MRCSARGESTATSPEEPFAGAVSLRVSPGESVHPRGCTSIGVRCFCPLNASFLRFHGAAAGAAAAPALRKRAEQGACMDDARLRLGERRGKLVLRRKSFSTPAQTVYKVRRYVYVPADENPGSFRRRVCFPLFGFHRDAISSVSPALRETETRRGLDAPARRAGNFYLRDIDLCRAKQSRSRSSAARITYTASVRFMPPSDLRASDKYSHNYSGGGGGGGGKV